MIFAAFFLCLFVFYGGYNGQEKFDGLRLDIKDRHGLQIRAIGWKSLYHRTGMVIHGLHDFLTSSL